MNNCKADRILDIKVDEIVKPQSSIDRKLYLSP